MFLKNLSAIPMKRFNWHSGFLMLSIFASVFDGCSNSSIEYIEEEVEFRNENDGTILAGTFTKPKGDYDFPVAIMISGSGQQDRDASIYGHKPFKALAEYLSANGIGILRYDDRGIGGSIGNIWNASLEIQASDAYAGIKYLRSRNDVDHLNIGIIGHSLGGMQGTILASKYPDISFLVLLGSIGLPWGENHIKADNEYNRRKGEPEEIIIAGSQLLESLLEAIKAMPTYHDYDNSKTILIDVIKSWQNSLDGIAKSEIEKFTRSHPDYWVKNIAEEYATPIYISCAKFDPAEYLAKVECRVLSIIGEKDLQVIPENNSAIRAALNKGGNQNCIVWTPKDINHLFQKCETGSIKEYASIEEDFNLEIMMRISEWIKADIE